MSEYFVASLLSLAGLCVLAVSAVVLAIKSEGDRVISWKGLGVIFEIKPCNQCPARKVTR